MTGRKKDPVLPRLADQFDAASLEAAREELERERRRQRLRPHRALLAAVVAVLVGGGLGGVAVAVKAIIADGGSQGSGVRPPRDTSPAPAGLDLKVARAADPVGGDTPPGGFGPIRSEGVASAR